MLKIPLRASLNFRPLEAELKDDEKKMIDERSGGVNIA
jgi:hypothetical protein